MRFVIVHGKLDPKTKGSDYPTVLQGDMEDEECERLKNEWEEATLSGKPRIGVYVYWRNDPFGRATRTTHGRFNLLDVMSIQDRESDPQDS